VIEAAELRVTATASTEDGRLVAYAVIVRDGETAAEAVERAKLGLASRIATGSGRHVADVPVKPFRDAAHRLVNHGSSWDELARRCGYTRRDTRPGRACRDGVRGDGSKLKRNLGIGAELAKLTVRRETAVKLCDALGLDPVDVGL
jgi:hypothetical protein